MLQRTCRISRTADFPLLFVFGQRGRFAFIVFCFRAAFFVAVRFGSLYSDTRYAVTSCADTAQTPERVIEALPREQRGLYPKTWSRFNNHFRLAKYCQLPQSRLSEAVAYLAQLDVTEDRQALPSALTALSPAPTFRTEFPVDMHTGRKDALRKIQSLMTGVDAARDVVRLFCHPRGKFMSMTFDEREIYDALYQLYCAADDSLLAAYRALDAGYRIGRQYGAGKIHIFIHIIF